MAAIRPRRRRDGGTSYTVTWRLGGARDGAQQTETFHEKTKARTFRQDVEDAGHQWPDGWVKGYGYVRVVEEPDAPAEPRLLTEFGREYVEASRAAILEGFALTEPDRTEHLSDFVAALDAVDPQLVASILDQAESVTTYETHWMARLAGSEEERAAASLLIERAIQASGPIRATASALRARLDDIDPATS